MLYRFLRIDKSDSKNELMAICLNHENGIETTFYHKLFENISENTDFIFNESGKIQIIQENEIPVYLKKFKELTEKEDQEREKIKTENIASGKYIYSYEDGGELIRKTLSDNYEEFSQILHNYMFEKFESYKIFISSEPHKTNLEENFANFLEKAQSGDRLEWKSWYAGPFAANSGPAISRNGEVIHYMTYMVS